ncbi:type 2 periplasmic-binding domain-containing protein [Glutamicibacter nicotianae]|uniref:hypothetical protein n=1 Tax=Glutamicibacter nicotianae TaxID=37929 RepID=UPI00167FB903|nr:hypothetical protein [Glutamicibacter nicotianae]
MSKTFSNAGGNRDIRVIDDSGRGFVIRALDHDGARSISVIFNNDTAPALALAILEAAGCRSYVGSGDDLGLAVENLDKHIAWVEAQNVEAEAQAKLEAEALELAKAGCEVVGDESVQKLSDMTYKDQRFFLAVARRARELNKEDTK